MDGTIINGERLFEPKQSRVPTAILYAVIFFLTVLLLFYYMFGCIPIKGSSMENNIFDGQYAMIMRGGFVINPGDVVIVDIAEKKSDNLIIKRVIAIEGDRLLFVRSKNGLYVDTYYCAADGDGFTLCDESETVKERMTDAMFNSEAQPDICVMSYAERSFIESIDLGDPLSGKTDAEKQKIERLLKYVVSVPKNCLFFMGDNRNISVDSRTYGVRNKKYVAGKVLSIFDPETRAAKFMQILFNL